VSIPRSFGLFALSSLLRWFTSNFSCGLGQMDVWNGFRTGLLLPVVLVLIYGGST